MLFYERIAMGSKSSANGNTKTDLAHTNGVLNEAETSEYSSAISNDGEDTEADDNVTVVNGYTSGNGIALKQLESDGLRRRRGSSAKDPVVPR